MLLETLIEKANYALNRVNRISSILVATPKEFTSEQLEKERHLALIASQDMLDSYLEAIATYKFFNEQKISFKLTDDLIFIIHEQ